ncbi:hypothetical protein [Saccharopolyspora gloriosae]|uniref:hypothetical protein n=1 Tax=Saccharopolyspora gloriosae TaxID=455344 RepID=UPI001FB62B33|nr:hypothetical protein [Saccharopolyspora gloriosae]
MTIGVLGYLAPYRAMAARALSLQHTAAGVAAISSIAVLGGFYAIGINPGDGDVPVACTSRSDA